MKYDLHKKEYTRHEELQEYIYGSADVVGLMCLRVFCNGNEEQYNELKNPAMKLGSAFQKVNFLRDLKADMEELDRLYFPEMIGRKFNESTKKSIIEDIEKDFSEALTGIKRLPQRSKLAVLIAYYYYRHLLKKIKKAPASVILQERIRVSNPKKMYLLAKAALAYKFNLI
jgi:phytoene/squalene synthetase